MQDMAAADGITRHHRHHRFRAGADLPLEIENVEVMNAGIILIAAVVAADLLIAAGAKRFVAFTGQHDDADIVVIAGIRQRLNHLFDGQRTKCVAYLRAVDGDFGNPIRRFLVTNVGVAFGAVLPFNRGVKHCFIKRDHKVSFS